MWKLRNGRNGTGQDVSPGVSEDHLIVLRKVEKIYQTVSGPFPALRGVDLTVEAGEFVSVIGKSGSGKSTLINMLTGIDRPTAGEVRVAGAALQTMSEEQIAVWRGRHVGIVFQFFQLLPTLTAVENVMLAMDYGGAYGVAERPERAMHLLGQVGLADQAHTLPGALSGGQQQSAAIARALANDPPLLVADEPTGNLDSATAEVIFRLFESLAQAGKTVLMVTHDNDLARRAQRTVVLADGLVVNHIANVQPATPDRRPVGSRPRADGQAGRRQTAAACLEVKMSARLVRTNGTASLAATPLATAEQSPLVDVRQLLKRYEGLGGTVVALKGISLQIAQGEFVAIVGKSGSGKTTLVNMLVALDRLTAGEVWVAGAPVHRLSAERAAAWRGRTVGVVFQSFGLLPGLTALQNVTLPMDFAGIGTLHQRRERGIALLAQVGIADHAHKLPSAVSGGQQQRIAIARALANDPALLLADEPTGSLDSVTAMAVVEVFQGLAAQGRTVLMVTHDRELAQQAGRRIELRDGVITTAG